MSGSQYRAEIDGLRAFAVVPVILFHLGVPWMRGGYIGVDVFFVISGYLITRLLLVEHDEDRLVLSHFWLRRIRRLLPALLTVVATTLLVGFFLFYSIEVNSLGRQSVAALCSIANQYFWKRTGSYWGQGADDSALLHTWTLSLEEQFYILFPFFLVLLIKRFRKYLVLAVSLIVLTSLSCFVAYSKIDANASFYLLPFRAWELGSGSLLAAFAHQKAAPFQSFSRLAKYLAAAGLGVITMSCFLMSSEVGMSGGLVFPVLGTLSVLAFADRKQETAYRVLAAKPIVYIGRLSYSLYLWHWPIIVFLRKLYPGSDSAILSLTALVLTGWFGIASYHLIEQTTRRRQSTVKYVAFAMVGCLLLALMMVRYKTDVSMFSPTVWQGRLYNVAPNDEFNWDIAQLWRGIEVSEPQQRKEDAYANGGVIHRYGGAEPEVVVLGDSHALMWAPVLDDLCQQRQLTCSFYAADGTDPFFEIPIRKDAGSAFMDAQQTYRFNQSRYELLKQWRPKIVIITVRWRVLQSFDAAQDLMVFLREIGTTVLLLEQPPEIFDRSKNTPQYLAFLGMEPVEERRQYVPCPQLEQQQSVWRRTKDLASQYDNCHLVELADLYLKSSEAWVLDGEDVLYIDSNHLSYQGALRGKARVEQKLSESLTADASEATVMQR